MLRAGDYGLRTVQDADLEPIRDWRNAQLPVLRQSAPISPRQQCKYYAANVWATLASPRPSQILLGFLQHDTLIGYGGLVHIGWDDRRAEVSFLLEPGRAGDIRTYAADFTAFLGLLATLAFDGLGLQRLWTETYAVRPHHVAVLEACGFVPEGVLRRHVIIDGRPVDALLHGRLAHDSH